MTPMTRPEIITHLEALLASMVADGKTEVEQEPLKLVIDNLKSLPQPQS